MTQECEAARLELNACCEIDRARRQANLKKSLTDEDVARLLESDMTLEEMQAKTGRTHRSLIHRLKKYRKRNVLATQPRLTLLIKAAAAALFVVCSSLFAQFTVTTQTFYFGAGQTNANCIELTTDTNVVMQRVAFPPTNCASILIITNPGTNAWARLNCCGPWVELKPTANQVKVCFESGKPGRVWASEGLSGAWWFLTAASDFTIRADCARGLLFRSNDGKLNIKKL